MGKAGTHLYEKVVNEGLSYDNYEYLESFLDHDTGFSLNNFQTGLLAGINAPEPLDYSRVTFFKPSNSEDLERAKRNLDKFSVIGLTERMDETLWLMKKALSWEYFPYYENANVTARRPKLSEIPKHTLRLIEKHNELDCELYEYGKKKFDERMQKEILSFVDGSESMAAKGSRSPVSEKTSFDLFILRNKLEGAQKEISSLRAEIDKQKNEAHYQMKRAEKFKKRIEERNKNRRFIWEIFFEWIERLNKFIHKKGIVK